MSDHPKRKRKSKARKAAGKVKAANNPDFLLRGKVTGIVFKRSEFADKTFKEVVKSSEFKQAVNAEMAKLRKEKK